MAGSKLGIQEFKSIAKTKEVLFDSFTGLLVPPLAVAGSYNETLATKGVKPRRGQPVKYDEATKTYKPMLHSRVISKADGTSASGAAIGTKIVLSNFLGLAPADAVRAVDAAGAVTAVTVSAVQFPVRDPFSGITHVEGYVTFAQALPANVKYIALEPIPAGRCDGLVTEDSDTASFPVGVRVEGAKVSEVMGADIPTLAAAMKLTVRNDLVFFAVTE